jgi:hypothetical protein
MLLTQRALCELRFTLPDPSVLNLAFGLLLDGPFDRAAMEWTLQELVRRHEPLRTAYSGTAGSPVAEVAPDAAMALEYEDLSAASGQNHVALLDCFRDALRCRVDAPPLLRARCLLLEPDRHVLLLTFNHLAVDGWALELFGREAEQLYAARLARAASPLPPLGTGQLDSIEREWENWRCGAQARAELDQRRREFAHLDPRVVRPFGSAVRNDIVLRRRVLAVPQDVLKTWRASSTKAGLTLFPAIISAVAVALCRQFGLQDVVLSALIANRHSTAAQRVLGAHYGATALRIAAAEGTAINDVMNQVVDRLLATMSHRLDIGALAGLMGECAGASGPLAPSCMVMMDRYPMNRLLLEDVTVTPISTLAVPAHQLHRDLDIASSPGVDFGVFLRHFGDSAGITIFWDPARVPGIDALIQEIARALALLGGGLSCDASALEPGEGTSSCAVDQDGWVPVVPVTDALSPLPLSGIERGG